MSYEGLAHNLMLSCEAYEQGGYGAFYILISDKALEDKEYNDLLISNYLNADDQKPLAHQLTYDKENLEYIKSVLSDKNIAEYKIAIAYGSAHASNKNVVAMKMAVLDMIQKTFQSQQIYHIVTEYLSTENPIATHVLNLGLRHGDEKWILQKMDVNEYSNAIVHRFC